jgi:hypothetical protein
MLRSTIPRLLIMALLKPPQLKDSSFMADRLQPATIGSRLAHTYLQKCHKLITVMYVADRSGYRVQGEVCQFFVPVKR